ncbi:MAG: FtsW/RodA/SpoVE family cell cycle protein, partial [bacterium]
FGLGLGHSRQKMHWLPDPFTDFIFSIIGEELGTIGTLLVVMLFLIIFYRGYRIALAAPDRQGQLLALGVTFSIVLYGFVNIAVVTNLLPTTGIPMPFVSYGGSSLIVNLFGAGILLNICQQSGFRALKPVRLRNGTKTKRKIKINR